MRRRLPAGVIAAALGLVSVPGALAQVQNGPPIPPEQVIRQQAAPLPAASAASPNAPAAAGQPRPYAAPRTGMERGANRDRASQCQHEAALERVPRGERGAYVHNCMK